MKGLTKTIAMLLVLVLAMGMLSACGEGDDAPAREQGAQEKPGDNGAQAGDTEAEEPVTIEWLAYNCYGQPDPNSEVVKMVEERFNVKFEFWYIDDQKWDEVLGVKFASGDMPDVMRIKNTSTIPNLVKQGILVEVTDDMLAKIPTYQENIKKIDPDGLAMIDSYYEGKLYALKGPSWSGSYPTVLTWRKDWLNNVGIDKIPETMEEFEEAIYKFALEDPDGNGKKDTFGLSNTALNAVFGAYGPIPLKEFRGTGTQNLFYTLEDGKIEFAAVQPEMKAALAKLQQWYEDGVLDPEFITGENKGGYWAVSQDFENGKVGVTGMSMSSHWAPPGAISENAGPVFKSFNDINPGTVWGETIEIGPSIVGPEGKSGTHKWGQFNTTGIGFTQQALDNPRKMDAILAIMEAANSDFETTELFKFGIEGKHFEKDENGTYLRMEGYKSTAEVNQAGLEVFSLGGVTDESFEKRLRPKAYEFYDIYKSTGYSDILVPQTEAANMYLTDLKTFALNAYLMIIVGEKEVDYFDTFVEEFNELGGQAIIEEINSKVQ